MKKSKANKLLSLLLAVIITVGTVPMTAISVSASTTGTIDSGLEYSIENDEVTITDYTGNATDVVIPAEIDGYPVTTIGAEAFKSCSHITSITIPPSIDKIEADAFNGCSNLTAVYIEDIVSWMQIDFGWYTHEYVPGDWPDPPPRIVEEYSYANPLEYAHNLYVNGVLLTDLVIPEGTTQIKPYAFRGCYSLKNVYVPSSMESFGRSAFQGRGVLNVYVDSITDWLDITFEYSYTPVVTDWNGDGNECNSNPISGGSLYVDGSLVTDLYIPEGISAINPCAFIGYSKLNSVMLPESIKSIGKEAFRNAVSAVHYTGTAEQLKSVSIADKSMWESCPDYHTVEDIEIVYTRPINMEAGCVREICSECGLIFTETSYVIKDGEAIITNYTGRFATELVIPTAIDGYPVTSIDSYAFSDCTKLKRITVPSCVLEINDYAFSGCTSLEEVELSEGVEYIWSHAFEGCTSLKKAVIPQSVSVIEYKAFYKCKALENVTYNGSSSEFKKISIDNGNEILFDVGITYLSEDEPSYVFIPVPEGMKAEDCILYYVDGYGIATPVQVEFIGGYFVTTVQKAGYYIVRNTASVNPEIVVVPGDLSGDGEVNAKDANYLKQAISGSVSIEKGSNIFFSADLNSDGELNAKDSNIFKRVLAGGVEL